MSTASTQTLTAIRVKIVKVVKCKNGAEVVSFTAQPIYAK